MLRAPIVDFSRGGVTVRCDWEADAGTAVQIELFGTDRPLPARIARFEDGVLTLGFRGDEERLRLVDLAPAARSARAGAAAA